MVVDRRRSEEGPYVGFFSSFTASKVVCSDSPREKNHADFAPAKPRGRCRMGSPPSLCTLVHFWKHVTCLSIKKLSTTAHFPHGKRTEGTEYGFIKSTCHDIIRGLEITWKFVPARECSFPKSHGESRDKRATIVSMESSARCFAVTGSPQRSPISESGKACRVRSNARDSVSFIICTR